MRTEIISKPNITTFFPTELILLFQGFDVSNVISEDRFEFISELFYFLTVKT